MLHHNLGFAPASLNIAACDMHFVADILGQIFLLIISRASAYCCVSTTASDFRHLVRAAFASCGCAWAHSGLRIDDYGKRLIINVNRIDAILSGSFSFSQDNGHWLTIPAYLVASQ